MLVIKHGGLTLMTITLGGTILRVGSVGPTGSLRIPTLGWSGRKFQSIVSLNRLDSESTGQTQVGSIGIRRLNWLGEPLQHERKNKIENDPVGFEHFCKT